MSWLAFGYCCFQGQLCHAELEEVAEFRTGKAIIPLDNISLIGAR